VGPSDPAPKLASEADQVRIRWDSSQKCNEYPPLFGPCRRQRGFDCEGGAETTPVLRAKPSKLLQMDSAGEIMALDRHMIILRGVPGSGKTQIALSIVRKLSDEGVRKDLGAFAPDNEQPQFEALIEDALNYRYVVVELYSGKKHSSEPLLWLGKFKEMYVIRSFVLSVSEQKGFSRCSEPRHTSWNDPTPEQYHEAYQKFASRQDRKEFTSKTGLIETVVETEDGDWERISSQILELFGLTDLREPSS
jgi:hypothetical protein